MTLTRCTAVFGDGNVGWSESYYRDFSDLPSARSAFEYLLGKRLGFLGSRFQIGFTRYVQIEAPFLRRFLINKGLVGSGVDAGDTAWQSIKINLTDTIGRRRVLLARGCPDLDITSGFLAIGGNDGASLSAFLLGLSTLGWSIYGGPKPPVLIGVVNVSDTGLVTTAAPSSAVVGNRIKFFRTHALSGKLVSGVFTVVGVTNPTAFSITPWPSAETVVGGKFYFYLPFARTISLAQFDGVRTHKVGRPFGLLRGRQRRRVPFQS